MAKPKFFDIKEHEPDSGTRAGFYAYIVQCSDTLTMHYSCNFDDTPPNVHSHDYDQTLFIIKGNCVVMVDDVEYELTEGSFIYIPPYAVHNYVRKFDCEECVFLEIMNPKIPDRPESPKVKDLGHNW